MSSSAPVSVSIEDFGAARAKIFTFLRAEFGISPARAKRILDSPGAELIRAEYGNVRELVEQLRALGAKVRFTPLEVLSVSEAVDEEYGWNFWGVYTAVEGLLTVSDIASFLTDGESPWPAVCVRQPDITERAFSVGISPWLDTWARFYEKARVEGVLHRMTGLSVFPAVMTDIEVITLFPEDREPIRIDFTVPCVMNE